MDADRKLRAGGAEFVHGAAPVTRALMRDFCAEG
jgi:hypothetical protein